MDADKTQYEYFGFLNVGKEIMLISNYKNYIIIILHQDYKNKEMIKVGVNDAASYLLDA